MNQGSVFRVHDNPNLVTQPIRNHKEATLPRGIFGPCVDNMLRLLLEHKARVDSFELHNHADSGARFHMLAGIDVDLVDEPREGVCLGRIYVEPTLESTDGGERTDVKKSLEHDRRLDAE